MITSATRTVDATTLAPTQLAAVDELDIFDAAYELVPIDAPLWWPSWCGTTCMEFIAVVDGIIFGLGAGCAIWC